MNDRSLSGRISIRITLVLVAALIALLAALPVTAYAVSYATEELEFLRLINEYRQQNGRGSLLLSDALSDACEKHSGDMAKYQWFSHYSERSDHYPAGSTPWYRIAQSGYSAGALGENIAAGQSTAASVLGAWKGSPTHDDNMLVADYKVIGIGLVHLPGSPYGYYWTTDFGSAVDSTAHDPSGSTTTTIPPSTTITTVPAASTGSWLLVAGGPDSDVFGLPAFWFDGSKYISCTGTDMVAGKGYWAALASTPANLTTVPRANSLTVSAGWNLIGNATGVTRGLPPGAVGYRFNGSSYVSSTSVPAGEGAWVRVPTAGTLVLQ